MEAGKLGSDSNSGVRQCSKCTHQKEVTVCRQSISSPTNHFTIVMSLKSSAPVRENHPEVCLIVNPKYGQAF